MSPFPVLARSAVPDFGPIIITRLLCACVCCVVCPGHVSYRGKKRINYENKENQKILKNVLYIMTYYSDQTLEEIKEKQKITSSFAKKLKNKIKEGDFFVLRFKQHEFKAA